MNQNLTPQANPPVNPGPGQQGRGPSLAIILACLAAGLAAGAFLTLQFGFRHQQTPSPGQPSDQDPALSAPTSDVLRHLEVPVEVRFYCSLDPATVPPTTPAFAQRAQRLLSHFEREAGGKLKLALRDFQPNSGDDKAALADGIKPFNIEKGDACFLGVAVVGKAHRETLDRLAPEWEPALEFDLARAIARTAQAGVPPPPVIVAPKGGPPPIDEVKRLIPNLDAVSLEEGTRLLREAALTQFASAAQEMRTRIERAQATIVRAQTSHSDAEQQAAMKQLQQLQAEQTDKLQQIAARSKAEIQTLERLKTAAKSRSQN
jgi:hypothetical protein